MIVQAACKLDSSHRQSYAASQPSRSYRQQGKCSGVTQSRHSGLISKIHVDLSKNAKKGMQHGFRTLTPGRRKTCRMKAERHSLPNSVGLATAPWTATARQNLVLCGTGKVCTSLLSQRMQCQIRWPWPGLLPKVRGCR